MTDQDEKQLPLDQCVGRFIFSRRHFRVSDSTVKPAAFNPSPYDELSVQSLHDCSAEEVWRYGNLIRTKRIEAGVKSNTLYGRADISVAVCRTAGLRAIIAPVDDNPHHVNIVDWPRDRSDILEKAAILAREAKYVNNPDPA